MRTDACAMSQTASILIRMWQTLDIIPDAKSNASAIAAVTTHAQTPTRTEEKLAVPTAKSESPKAVSFIRSKRLVILAAEVSQARDRVPKEEEEEEKEKEAAGPNPD